MQPAATERDLLTDSIEQGRFDIPRIPGRATAGDAARRTVENRQAGSDAAGRHVVIPGRRASVVLIEWIVNGLGMFSVLRRRRRAPEISVGARYCRRDASNIVWEVYSLFTGTDGMPYAGIFCISDPTRRKTVSRSVLEHDGQYVRVVEE